MSKRHSGDSDDAFIARILDLSKWAKNNQQAMTVAAAVVAIMMAGGLYYRNYQSQLRDQAAEQLETIHQSIAINDVLGAETDLVTFLDRFGSTAYAGEARLMLGELYLEGGNPQQALAVLEPLGSSPRRPIEFQGATLLGAAYEQEGRLDEAEETYLDIANRSELSFQIRDALASAARIRSVQGDADGAIELYERVLEGLDVSAPERGLYEMRIEEIRANS